MPVKRRGGSIKIQGCTGEIKLVIHGQLLFSVSFNIDYYYYNIEEE